MQLSYALFLQIRDLGAVLREYKDIKNNLSVSKNFKKLLFEVICCFSRLS